MPHDIKLQVINKFIKDNGSGQMQRLLAVVTQRLFLYRKKGFTHVEALNRIINKLIKKRCSGRSPSDNSSQTTSYDMDLVSKIRKASGMSYEETIKTLQLQKELDSLLEARMHQDSGSSEDSVNNGGIPDNL